jgi:hypothetical protein
MADIMNKIKFLSDVKIPRLTVTDKAIVKGGLEVEGTVITKNREEITIKDNFTIYNPGAETTLDEAGEIILTGMASYSYTSYEEPIKLADKETIWNCLQEIFNDNTSGVSIDGYYIGAGENGTFYGDTLNFSLIDHSDGDYEAKEYWILIENNPIFRATVESDNVSFDYDGSLAQF